MQWLTNVQWPSLQHFVLSAQLYGGEAQLIGLPHFRGYGRTFPAIRLVVDFGHSSEWSWPSKARSLDSQSDHD